MSKNTKLTSKEAHQALKQLEDWKLIEDENADASIQKVFQFPTYLAGIEFVNEVAKLAEAVNHHPELIISWCKVTVQLTTHDASGLTPKDFALATQIDENAL